MSADVRVRIGNLRTRIPLNRGQFPRTKNKKVSSRKKINPRKKNNDFTTKIQVLQAFENCSNTIWDTLCQF